MWMYLFIFVCKIIEVSFTTVRTVLITRGEKLYAATIGFFEVIIWLLVVGNVLNGIQEDPIKIIVYALGYACGNYVGSIIEDKLAIGMITMNVIVSEEDGEKLINTLRDAEVGVTSIEGEGRSSKKLVLLIHLKRKRKLEIMKLIEETEIKSVISVTDIKTVYGGYGMVRK
ncbi:DUF2179 domain-containing protein [Clostridium senegalense]|uniref:DUF2179 domain-containing protein n=1 Tax=Clostridium senegalense TaxID=1465809 RepID=UPI00028858F4|nr:DUF5698 domain-containing protein [Clostridium senegalense]MBU5227770.1 DUF2179 domain-containing protein [Clostridium senegalense]